MSNYTGFVFITGSLGAAYAPADGGGGGGAVEPTVYLQNGMFNTNLDSWTVTAGSPSVITSPKLEGDRALYFGSGSSVLLHQDLIVDSDLGGKVDSGDVKCISSAYFTRNQFSNDEGRFQIKSYNAADTLLDTKDSGYFSIATQGDWQQKGFADYVLPVGTRKVRVELEGRLQSGGAINVYVDAVTVSLRDGPFVVPTGTVEFLFSFDNTIVDLTGNKPTSYSNLAYNADGPFAGSEASLQFGSASSSVFTIDDSHFEDDFLTEFFCVETFAKLTTASPSNQYEEGAIFGNWNNNGFNEDSFMLYIDYDNVGGLIFFLEIKGETAHEFDAIMVYDTWHHIALVRNSTTIILYLDGVADDQVYTINNFRNIGGDSSEDWNFGNANSGDRSFKGRLSNSRLTIGGPVYTEDFTVPTAAFTV